MQGYLKTRNGVPTQVVVRNNSVPARQTRSKARPALLLQHGSTGGFFVHGHGDEAGTRLAECANLRVRVL